MRTLFLVSLLCLIAPGLQAASFDYDYVELRAGSVDIDGEAGLALLGGISKSLDKQRYLIAAYQFGTALEYDYWQDDLFVGVGQHQPLGEADLFVTAGLLNEWQEWCAYYCGGDSDLGLRLSGGLRQNLGQGLELGIELSYVAIFDDSNIGVLVNLQADNIGAMYESNERMQIISVYTRF